ncbi:MULTISPECIES: lycopene beta-cyclase CrtY [Sphingomonas]|uniref:Lycopene beta-cyclase n=1 Tax=Sphingomonas carotinifaciens TaxID=1166323 RepID=A0A1G7NPX6_9SPHN|nr:MULTISPECIES: lycopene beta-cyclase CrtY [Sphingomonas]MBB4087004.1 lycopene beta-cyclase [Sphingomonas carotinifaciens]MWC43306.1 lycopene beta-cyclase CrtY [Sphingomonas carotinifaciens]SDF75977.1 lycopene beta-cyclase [Sphingomonas carotinifaciens]
MASTIACDVAIVGAGLAGSLVALALKGRHPDLDVRLVDAGDSIGGNHLWSFFGSDVARADRWIVERAVAHAWASYDVAFPAHGRTIAQPYYSIESSRLDRVVRATLPEQALLLGRKALGVSATAVVLADGDRIEAKGVIDTRGTGDLSTLDCGWQKFVGRELALAAPHGRERPVVMDATVKQVDGYRFVYVLPFGADRIFVEDTYYSTSADLNRGAIVPRLERYAAAMDWDVTEVVREEAGVLPVAMGGNFEAYWRSGGAKTPKAGMRAGLFHPTTGYSLPDAIRTASAIAARRDFAGADLHDLTYGLARDAWDARKFYRMLDTMLFRAAEPEERYRVLERFYRLAPGLIGRFYAGQSTMADKARILTGRPPVPIGRAISALRGARA